MFDITRIFQIQLHYIYLIMFAKVYTVIVQARSFHFDLFMLRITLLIIHCAAIFIQKLHAKTNKKNCEWYMRNVCWLKVNKDTIYYEDRLYCMWFYMTILTKQRDGNIITESEKYMFLEASCGLMIMQLTNKKPKKKMK